MVVGPVVEHLKICLGCGAALAVTECLTTHPGAYCPVSEFPLQNCPVCGYKVAERAKSIEIIDELPPKPPLPKEVTQQIICPQCGSTLEITTWEGYEFPPPMPLPYYYIMPPLGPLRILNCPVCGFAVALGLSITVVESKPWPPEGETPEAGIIDWLKANWKWLTVGGVSLGVIIALARRRQK